MKIQYVGNNTEGVVIDINGRHVLCAPGKPVEVPDSVASGSEHVTGLLANPDFKAVEPQ